jgi:hypothetical protein
MSVEKAFLKVFDDIWDTRGSRVQISPEASIQERGRQFIITKPKKGVVELVGWNIVSL